MTGRPRQIALALAACGLLTACGATSYDEEMVAGAEPVYCYQTLATPDCYDRPQPGPPNRLIGRAPIVVLP